MLNLNWYYELEGEKKGPVLGSEILKLVEDKSLFPYSLVWKEGMSEWLKISEIAEFKNLSEPPPLPISHVSSGYILSVVTLPIWGAFLQLIICAVLAKENDELMWQYYDNKIWIFSYMVINTILCAIDSSNLAKSGSKVSAIWAFFLVPVYIYKRGAELMKIHGGDYLKNHLFFFIWFISFIVVIILEMQLRD